MARVPFVTSDSVDPALKAAYDALAEHHAVTNMKAALLHSPEALHAVLEWYALNDKVKPFLGERLSVLFCDAISRANECILCSTFMHREIVKWGEDPNDLKLDERDKAVIAFGRQIVKNHGHIDDELFDELQSYFTTAQLVDLATYGAMMVVNNLFNSIFKVDLDTSLDGYHIDPETYFV